MFVLSILILYAIWLCFYHTILLIKVLLMRKSKLTPTRAKKIMWDKGMDIVEINADRSVDGQREIWIPPGETPESILMELQDITAPILPSFWITYGFIFRAREGDKDRYEHQKAAAVSSEYLYYRRGRNYGGAYIGALKFLRNLKRKGRVVLGVGVRLHWNKNFKQPL